SVRSGFQSRFATAQAAEARLTKKLNATVPPLNRVAKAGRLKPTNETFCVSAQVDRQGTAIPPNERSGTRRHAARSLSKKTEANSWLLRPIVENSSVYDCLGPALAKRTGDQSLDGPGFGKDRCPHCPRRRDFLRTSHDRMGRERL